MAGPDLNRRTFVEAMSKITNFPGSLAPIWSFGPNKMYGPTQYQVVEVHNNVPPSSQCILKTNDKPQGTCWVVVQKSKPLPPASPGRAGSGRAQAENVPALHQHEDPDGAVEERCRRRRRSRVTEHGGRSADGRPAAQPNS